GPRLRDEALDLVAAAELVDAHAGLHEVVAQQSRDLGFVLDDQDVGAHARGSRRLISRPPAADFAAATVPACASMIDLQIDRPSPAPPVARVRAVSTR